MVTGNLKDKAISGLSKSVNQFNKAAQKISEYGTSSSLKDEHIYEIEDKITLSQDDSIDLTKQFVKIELAQVCYNANAKLISVNDDLTSTIINIKA